MKCIITFRPDNSVENRADIWFGHSPCFLYPDRLVVGGPTYRFLKIKERLKLQELI